MLSNFLIGLREGLEAALIVGILVAYIVKTNQASKQKLLTAVWIGVSVALIASLALGGFLSFTSAELTPRGEEFFAGTTSLLAVGLVTWMVFWMKRTARSLRQDLQGKVETALSSGPLTLAAAAFFAVLREGLETSLFVYANFRSIDGEGVGSWTSIRINNWISSCRIFRLGYLSSSNYFESINFFQNYWRGINCYCCRSSVLRSS